MPKGTPSARRWRPGAHREDTPRIGAIAAALVGVGLLAVACGGSPGNHVAQLGSTTTTQRGTSPIATGKYAAALAYSGCMRSHGVPNFPDPKQVGGGGIQISGAQSGMDPNSPAFKSAQQACRHLLPGGGQPTQAAQQQELAKMLHISQCMRAHGISGFPDPTLSPPSDRAGHSEIMSNDGVWLAIPNSIDTQSPAFEHAAAACNFGQS
ncbi:MAG: hypothetical protein WCF24_03455 [Acidimicrobiales bacterium]